VDDGLSPAQSFSKHLFLNAGIMAFYTGNGRMIRHTAITQPWASGSRATPTKSVVPKVQDGAPELVHVVAPPHARESEVKKVALLLGTLRSFERIAAAASLDSCFAATYMQRHSAVLASDFALEGVRFYPHAPDPHAKGKLLNLDDTIAQHERELAATISAGTLLGSRESMKALQDREGELNKKADGVSVLDWVQEVLPPRATPDDTNDKEERSEIGEDFAHAEEVPEGLDIASGMCPPDLASSLVNWCENQDWGSGKLLQFGWEYARPSKALVPAPPLPEIFTPLYARLKGSPEKGIDQIIVRRYEPGDGLRAHVDNKNLFGPTVWSLSLGADINMDLIHYGSKTKHITRLYAGDILTLDGKARYEWRHGIRPRMADEWDGETYPRQLRYSVSFRTVVNK
jgi:alkylated DNA repair dioxygenase AlkB